MPADDNKPYTLSEVRINGGLAANAFSADSKLAATGGGGEIRIWTVPTGKEIIQMQLPDKNPGSVAFSEDGKQVVSASAADRKIRFWSLATGKQVKELDLPKAKDVLWIVGFSPGAKRVAVKVTNGIYLADPITGKVTTEFAGAGPGSSSFKLLGGAFSRDGKRFAAGVGKVQLAVWNVETGKQLAISPPEKHDR